MPPSPPPPGRLASRVSSDATSSSAKASPRITSSRRMVKPKQSTRWTSLPNTTFGIPVGICGNAVLWRTMAAVPFTRDAVGKKGNWVFFIAGLVVWCLVTISFIIKVWKSWKFVVNEWCHPARVYFFFMPHIALAMLTISSPQALDHVLRPIRTGSFCVCLFAQIVLCLVCYARWMFSPVAGDLGHASPPYLLSTVGWPLLASLAQMLDLERRWHVNLAALLFGPGAVFYTLAFISITQTMHTHAHAQGAPSLFLTIAPPSVMAGVLANFTNGEFGTAPKAVFGFCLVQAVLLVRLGPKLLERPDTLGVYWAYTFPIAALAATAVRYAATEGTESSKIIAWTLILLANVTLCTVVFRMSTHLIVVAAGHSYWTDPLLPGSPRFATTRSASSAASASSAKDLAKSKKSLKRALTTTSSSQRAASADAPRTSTGLASECVVPGARTPPQRRPPKKKPPPHLASTAHGVIVARALAAGSASSNNKASSVAEGGDLSRRDAKSTSEEETSQREADLEAPPVLNSSRPRRADSTASAQGLTDANAGAGGLPNVVGTAVSFSERGGSTRRTRFSRTMSNLATWLETNTYIKPHHHDPYHHHETGGLHPHEMEDDEEDMDEEDEDEDAIDEEDDGYVQPLPPPPSDPGVAFDIPNNDTTTNSRAARQRTFSAASSRGVSFADGDGGVVHPMDVDEGDDDDDDDRAAGTEEQKDS